MEEKQIDTSELAEILDARDKLCAFCGCVEYCDCCHVTTLANNAMNCCSEYSEETEDEADSEKAE